MRQRQFLILFQRQREVEEIDQGRIVLLLQAELRIVEPRFQHHLTTALYVIVGKGKEADFLFVEPCEMWEKTLKC